MPTWGCEYEYRNDSRRIAAWQAHYVRKGCTRTKAEKVAYQKVHVASTWPPAPSVNEARG
jgi:hypothetical protein